jgi:hypothetical protein
LGNNQLILKKKKILIWRRARSRREKHKKKRPLQPPLSVLFGRAPALTAPCFGDTFQVAPNLPACILLNFLSALFLAEIEMTCKLSTLMTGKLSTLIVGDGNFSFSCALVRLGKLPHPPCELTATSYDSKETLIEKYGDRAARNVEGLEMEGCRVMCGVDATNLSATFSPERTFDTIIFQHPLIDRNDRYVKAQAGEMSAKEDYIIANRLLILDFLLSAKQLLQEPDGEIKVTVKQVHPYTLWRVASLQEYAGGLALKRVEAFKNKDYPGKNFYEVFLDQFYWKLTTALRHQSSAGYETMNVEMNHAFPSETATTFIFGLPQSSCGVEQLDIGTISQVPRGKVCVGSKIYTKYMHASRGCFVHRCTEVEIRRTLRDEIEESPIEFMKLPNTEYVLWGDAYKFNQKTFLKWERRTRIFNVFSFHTCHS